MKTFFRQRAYMLPENIINFTFILFGLVKYKYFWILWGHALRQPGNTLPDLNMTSQAFWLTSTPYFMNTFKFSRCLESTKIFKDLWMSERCYYFPLKMFSLTESLCVRLSVFQIKIDNLVNKLALKYRFLTKTSAIKISVNKWNQCIKVIKYIKSW